MKITNDRSDLNEALNDPRTTVLLLFGNSDVVAKIHAKAEVVNKDPDQNHFWISDLTVLSADEVRDWSGGEGKYTTLSILGENGKRTIKSGPVAALCLSSGAPSAMAITQAFDDAQG